MRSLHPFILALAAASAATLHTAASAQTPPSPAVPNDAAPAPRWEAGLAAGVAHVSDYPGSDRSHLRGIVLPMLVYRGPVLRVEGGGIRGRFVHTPAWEFDLSATAAFNAKDNDARRGMPPLDYLFGIGPQLIYKGWQTPAGGPTLHLKWRALVSTDIRRIDARGYTFSPEIRWRIADVGTMAGAPAALTVSAQPSWASGRLQRYFYQVDATQATPARPAYAAHAGYLGTDLSATLDHRLAPGLSWFVTAQFMSLRGAANRASPLLRSSGNLNVGAGVVWTPWRSADLAGD